MQKVLSMFLFSLFVCCTVGIQTSTAQTAAVPAAAVEKPKKKVFRANKNQITQVQTMLKEKNLYGGTADGKLNDEMRASVKGYQKDNGLKSTGTLNRATIEKMGITLTEAQMTIPVSQSSFASAETKSAESSAADAKPKKSIFRATKEQIIEAQKMLKTGGLYSGEETGKLDDATRDSLKKYQTANSVKVTGTLNQITLEKMGIGLTDKQKGTAESK